MSEKTRRLEGLEKSAAAAKMKANPRITVITLGIPSSGRAIPLEMAIALQAQSWPANTGVGWSVVCGADVDVAREKIAESALELGSKYLWFVDDDTVPPMDAARKLLYVLQQEEAKGSNVMVAGGIYTYKQDPAEPMVFQGLNEGSFWKWRQGDVFPVWGMGAGCMMIRTEVFRHLPRPWFKFNTEPGKLLGEDLYFCKQVNDAGFGIMAHGGVLCRHWDMASMQVYTMPEDSYPMQPAEPEKKAANG
jgi:hypothetical protein